MRYPITTNYCADWGTNEMLREVFQNAIDHGEFTYKHENDTLTVISPNVTLSRDALLLGYSVKTPGAIGKFGEGLKLAMLVAARQNMPFTVRTGKMLWTVRLIKDQLDVKTSWAVYSPDTTVTISNVDIATYAPYNLHLTGEAYKTVLKDRPGDIFTGGLWVCHIANLYYGYNIDLRLDRDRRLASEFDVCYATSKYWAKHEDQAVQLIEAGEKDVQYMEHFASRTLVDKLAQRLNGKVVIHEQRDLEKYNNVILGSYSYAQLMMPYRPQLKPPMEDILCSQCRLAVSKWKLLPG